MLFKFLKVFIVSFLLIFVILNGRFLYANVNYFFNTPKDTSTLPTDKSSTPHLPLSEDRKTPTKPLTGEAILVIPKIGISAPIVFGVSNDDASILKSLEKSVVHYSDTPKPGLDGVSIILGHSSAYPWYKGHYGSVFALLGKLNPGDKFYVQYADGRVFNFLVKQSIVFSPLSNDARLTAIEKTPGSSLVLISCWPIGTNYKRIAIQAELI